MRSIPLAEKNHTYFFSNITECCDAAIAGVRDCERFSQLAAPDARDSRDPKNPRFWPAKKSPLPPAKNPLFCTFRGEKRAFSTDLCTKLHIFDTFFADIAPGLWAASPSGKNPPIYTVLNAAFSAPGPPRLWHRGGTPVPDALARAPVRPFRILQ